MTEEAGFHALLAMSAYHSVRDGVAYPAVMLSHGFNDPRVEPWQSGKMTARLQAATASDNPRSAAGWIFRRDTESGRPGTSIYRNALISLPFCFRSWAGD